ncbi:MAG: hypothetical protein ABW137_22925 [Mycobacterium sp.]
MTKPARTLSKGDAFAELQMLVDEGLIAFEGHSDENHVNLGGLNPVTGAMEAGNVAGVVVRRGEAAAAPAFLDPRNALALVRLCQYLSNRFGATDLFHVGISGDASGGRVDCHGQGRAVDFTGAARRVGDDTDFHLTVLSDWGSVTPSTPSTTSAPSTQSTQSAQSTQSTQCTQSTQNTTGYRLDGAGTLAEAFFRGVYQFAAGQWQDRSQDPDGQDVPTSIGDGGFILTPDHPTTAPTNHLHLQIGKSGTE